MQARLFVYKFISYQKSVWLANAEGNPLVTGPTVLMKSAQKFLTS